RATEVGIEPARPEFGGRKAQRHIGVASRFALAEPTGTDLDAAREDTIVGLDVVSAPIVGHDLNVGADRERLDLTLEALAVAGDITDGSHCWSPYMRARTVRATGATERPAEAGRANPSGPKRQRRTGAAELFAAKAAARSPRHAAGGEIGSTRWFRGAGCRSRS